MSSTITPTHRRLRRVAHAVLRSPVGDVLDALATPHGLDRYLELVSPLLVRDEHRAVVTEVHRETPDTTTLTLRPNRWQGHRAGQHVTLTVEIDGRRHTRVYSVSSSQHRDDGQLTITVKADPGGRVSPFLAHDARPGLIVGLSPAEGEFTLPDARPDRLLLVSGGSGITPVLSMLRTLTDEDAPTHVTFLHYARTRDDVVASDELRALAARRPDRVRLARVFTRDELASDVGLRGHLCADHLAALEFDGLHATDAYVCGPVGLLDAATQLWGERGAGERLHVERFQPAAVPPTDGDASGTITLARSGRTLDNDGRPLLDQAEAAGLSPQAGCRMGICHTCIKPKLSGRVRDARDGRTSSCDPEDVQLCISVPVGDVTLDL